MKPEFQEENDEVEYWTRGTAVYDLDECLKAIRIRNKDNEAKIERLQQENKRLRDEHYKDDKLAKMKSGLDKTKKDLYRGFPISEKEDEKIQNWFESHNKGKCKNIKENMLTYRFTPTEFGTIGTVRCRCGQEFDFQSI